MSSNANSISDEDGDFTDWIEILNAGSEAANLEGYGLSDNWGLPYKWQFPPIILPAGEHLLVFASGKDRRPEESASPDTVAGLQLWLDAGAIDPEDPAQVVQAAEDVRVHRWLDLSQNGHTAAQTQPAALPRWLPSAINGRPVLQFDGVDDYLEIPYSASLNGEGMSILAVARPDGGAGYQAVVSSRDDGPSGLSGYTFYADNENRWSFWIGVPFNWIQLTAPHAIELNSFYLLETRWDDYRTELLINGRHIQSENRLHFQNERRPLRIGAGTTETTPHVFFRGAIAELLIFDRRLEDAELRQLERYLATKYGLDVVHYLHTSFSIQSGGELLMLTSPMGNWMDAVGPVALTTGVSYGRLPNDPDHGVFFASPTPGEANLTEPFEGISGETAHHPEGGFFTGDVTVSLTTSVTGAVIYYTVDGSEPTENALSYTEPVLITETTVLRSRSIEPGRIPGPVSTHSYILNDEFSFPVISLSTSPSNLWDPDFGIFENYLPDVQGRDWQRSVYFEFFSEEGLREFASGADMGIHGGWNTTVFPQKSFKLIARNHYGADTFGYKFFPDRPMEEYGSVLLRNSGNDWRWTLFRDALMQRLAEPLNFEIQAWRPVIVLVNGHYWGIYSLQERIDGDYLKGNHPEAAGGVDLIKNYGVVEEGDPCHYNAMLRHLEQNDLEDPANYELLKAMMDVDSFVDYQAAEIFYNNEDWPGNNIRYWRPRLFDGRWRWILYDTDLGFRGIAVNKLALATAPSSPHPANAPWSTFLFRTLLRNAEFRDSFIIRFADLLNSTFDPDRVLTQIEMMHDMLAPEIPRHAARWLDDPLNTFNPFRNANEWEQQVQVLRNFAIQRPGFVWGHLLNQFNLEGTFELYLDATNSHGGRIRVNTLWLADLDLPWQGTYFAGMPLKLVAEPRPGYRFVGWSGDTNSTECTLEFHPSIDLHLQAAFEPDESPLFPAPHRLAAGSYSLAEWAEASPANSYPPHMAFLQTQVQDPGLGVEMNSLWTLPYNLPSRSRINGLGEFGFSFVNTGNAQQAAGAGYLGAAVVALNTLECEDIQVTWTGGTVMPNQRVYGIRLQYRIGTDGPFVDVLDTAGVAVEYVRNPTPGHAQAIGPIVLPEAANNQPHVELRWKYYFISGNSGPRAELRMDDIEITGRRLSTGRLVVASAPDTAQAGITLSHIAVEVQADGGATDYDGAIRLEKTSGPGTLSGTLERQATNGIAVFDDLSFDVPGVYSLAAAADGLNPVELAGIRVVGVTELILPSYIQGELPPNTSRVPYAFRLKFDGLLPNAVYRYANRFIGEDDSPTQDGSGNSVFITTDGDGFVRATNSPRFLNEDLHIRHSTFTTDEPGSYTGWFVTEPSGDPLFAPGKWVRPQVLLNNGQGGEDQHHFLTTTSLVQVIGFGTDVDEASALYGVSQAADGNFVVLYTDVAGESRPVSATMVEATGAEVDDSYSDFYVNLVAGKSGRWGTLLPNSLPSGIARIEERDAHGDIRHVFATQDRIRPTMNLREGSSPTGIQVPGPGDNGYTTWACGFFGLIELVDHTMTGITADPDQDGVPNLLEYAFGLDPLKTDLSGKPEVYVEEFYGMNFLRFEHRQRIGESGICYEIEISEDLTHWSAAGDRLTQIEEPRATEDDRIEIVTWMLPIEQTSRPHFLRLGVRLSD